MGIEAVRAFFAARASDVVIVEQASSTATVLEAADTLGVTPGQIAKTLSLRVGEHVVLIVTAGDTRLDNRKVKDMLGGRPRMLSAEEAEQLTGHPVGGVCPFGLATPLPVYCDLSLRRFDQVYPAAGARTASVRLSPDRLAALVGAEWADLCSLPGSA
ncbi:MULTISPECIES: YbaK/EbsC family protein [unclassified Sphingomonas]|uniref:YbaK/EbsC family protein n=1 Tax=unclassified Sphingomonas TaxID=196159 RepID=UPI000926A5E0|nr:MULTISPECIES: YbaK/EbsC family protein [unclassified Sphingomonas]OJU17762.1 MAG: cys-tRNA(pro)/cys-tRNA(cys) deacylase [Sphingomonas sp. 66-10]